MKRLNREGFWHSKHEPHLPKPRVCVDAWPSENFVANLKEIEKKAVSKSYRGFSTCRVCGTSNGSREFVHSGWTWPSGFRHYVEEHGVRPSLAFEEMINQEQQQ